MYMYTYMYMYLYQPLSDSSSSSPSTFKQCTPFNLTSTPLGTKTLSPCNLLSKSSITLNLDRYVHIHVYIYKYSYMYMCTFMYSYMYKCTCVHHLQLHVHVYIQFSIVVCRIKCLSFPYDTCFWCSDSEGTEEDLVSVSHGSTVLLADER